MDPPFLPSGQGVGLALVGQSSAASRTTTLCMPWFCKEAQAIICNINSMLYFMETAKAGLFSRDRQRRCDTCPF
eukprot:2470890-Pyramimonas_sp.AAC.1